MYREGIVTSQCRSGPSHLNRTLARRVVPREVVGMTFVFFGYAASRTRISRDEQRRICVRLASK